ncbi:MAG: hypothetical protein KF830_04705 [Planctomycetes bacterium]|nr:hypothetical protein [Planctomycetota bacterium]
MGETDEPDAAWPPPAGARPPLRAVDGPVGPAELAPPTRLCREFKGLTVADLCIAERAEQLPGRVRSALRHIERGDFAAAERVLPGEFAPVLIGPGRRRRGRRRAAFVFLAVVCAAVAALACAG